MIKMNNITFAFDEKNIFQNFSMELKKGEILAIMGPSGCGKTTLLGLASGLLKPQKGEIVNSFKKISCVFQEPRLFPWLTVKENLLAVMSKKDKDTEKTVLECLSLVGLEDTLDKYPDELSGGMKARVSIARTLAKEADIYIFDEPFANLDKDTAEKCAEVIKAKATHALIVAVLHDTALAERIADRVIYLK